MGEFKATLPGRHRYVAPTMAAAMAAAGSMKFLRSKPAKQMIGTAL